MDNDVSKTPAQWEEFGNWCRRMPIDLFLRCIREVRDTSINDSYFLYHNDSGEIEECIFGYEDRFDPKRPYWVGNGCDLTDGADFVTGEDMVDAKIYGGKSMRERWDDIRINCIGCMPVDFWMDTFCPFRKEVEPSEDGKCWRWKKSE